MQIAALMNVPGEIFQLAVMNMVTLWARTDLREIGTHFRREGRELEWAPYVLLTSVPVIIAIAIAWTYQYLQKRSPVIDSPEKLFREICRLHKFDSTDEQLVRQLAQATHTTDPAELLVLPHRFAAAADAAAVVLKSSQKSRIDSIRIRLFGSE